MEYNQTLSPVSAWFYVTYPLSALQTRVVCLPYQTTPSRALICFSHCSNIITLNVNQLRQILQLEGIPGLYKGFFPVLVHLLARDALQQQLTRLCSTLLYNEERVSCRSCREIQPRVWDFYGFHFSKRHRASVNSHFRKTDHWRSRLEAASLQVLSKKRWTEYLTELLAYPLLTCATRLVVCETGPDKLGLGDMLNLTYGFDGVTGFYRGLLPFLVTKSADDIVASLTSAQWLSHLSLSEVYTMKTCCAALLRSAMAPLNQLSIVQRCQSRMEGLCVYRPFNKVLVEMPWKAFTIQFGITCLLVGVNYMTTAQKPKDTMEVPSVHSPLYCASLSPLSPIRPNGQLLRRQTEAEDDGAY